MSPFSAETFARFFFSPRSNSCSLALIPRRISRKEFLLSTLMYIILYTRVQCILYQCIVYSVHCVVLHQCTLVQSIGCRVRCRVDSRVQGVEQTLHVYLHLYIHTRVLEKLTIGDSNGTSSSVEQMPKTSKASMKKCQDHEIDYVTILIVIFYFSYENFRHRVAYLQQRLAFRLF